MTLNSAQRITAAVLTTALLALASATVSSSCQKADTDNQLAGTWTGKSLCVGDRPACKNEVVVYRFISVPGKTDLFTVYGDKIVDGKRVVMGKLDFVYDKAKGTVSSEFTRGQTHGIFNFQLSGDTLKGTLIILPEKTVGRTIEVQRVTENKVPKAPPLSDY